MSVTRAARSVLIPWWLTLVEGIALVILGILLITNPAATAVALVITLGLYWMISGILGIVGIFINSHNWFWKLLLGILGIVAGFLILRHPLTSTLVVGSALVLWLAILGIMIGILNIIRAFTGEGWGPAILGIFSIILGGLLLANFWGITFSLPWSLGILAIIGGLLAIFQSIFRDRKIQNELEAAREAAEAKSRAAMVDASAATRSAAGAVGDATRGAAAAATGAAAAVAATAERTVDKAADTASDTAEAAGQAVSGAADAVTDTAEGAVDAVSGVAGAVAAKVDSILNPTNRDKIYDWAKAKGLTEGDVERFLNSPYADLLEKGKTPADRAALANELGISKEAVLAWLNRLDLERIKGVGVVYANLLETAGVDTVRELAQRNPTNLSAKLAEVNQTHGLAERLPTPNEVADWVQQAKALPTKLTY